MKRCTNTAKPSWPRRERNARRFQQLVALSSTIHSLRWLAMSSLLVRLSTAPSLCWGGCGPYILSERESEEGGKKATIKLNSSEANIHHTQSPSPHKHLRRSNNQQLRSSTLRWCLALIVCCSCSPEDPRIVASVVDSKYKLFSARSTNLSLSLALWRLETRGELFNYFVFASLLSLI